MQVANPTRGVHIGRWIAVVLVAAFLAMLAYGLHAKGTDDRIDEKLASGRPATAPAFSLEALYRGTLPPRLARQAGPALADGDLSLGELSGLPVVLNLWASW